MLDIKPMTLDEAVDALQSQGHSWTGESEKVVLRSYALGQVMEAMGRVEVQDALEGQTPGLDYKQYNALNHLWRSRIAAVLQEKKRELQ